MEYQFSDRVKALKPSAIREILKNSSAPGIIPLSAGNPAPKSNQMIKETENFNFQSYRFKCRLRDQIRKTMKNNSERKIFMKNKLLKAPQITAAFSMSLILAFSLIAVASNTLAAPINNVSITTLPSSPEISPLDDEEDKIIFK